MNCAGMMKIACLLVMVSLIPITSWSYEKYGEDGRRNPPAEAIEACEGKKVGDSVEFIGRRGKSLSATCEELDGQLVAIPKARRESGKHQ